MSNQLYLQQIDTSSPQKFYPKESTPEELVDKIKQILETQGIRYNFDDVNVKFTLLFANKKQTNYKLEIFSNTGRYATESASPLVVVKAIYGNDRDIMDLAMMKLLESLIQDGEVTHYHMRNFLATF